jgi:SAM-dependent methyltransferase
VKPTMPAIPHTNWMVVATLSGVGRSDSKTAPVPRLADGSVDHYSTAHGDIPAYRLDKLRAFGVLHGRWLDLGCGIGEYTPLLVSYGADGAVGIDPDESRIAVAIDAHRDDRTVEFRHAVGEALPLEDGSIDGVLLNEVLEHVADERVALSEIARVLRPGGHLALFSPNRFFPFEGHPLQVGGTTLDFPTPLTPWLPRRLTERVRTARAYWPGELSRLVADSGLEIVSLSTAFPQFDHYRWLPAPVVRRYKRSLPRIERTPGVRWFGVSVLVLGRKPQPS